MKSLIIGATITIILGLIGVVYNNLETRVLAVEIQHKSIDQLLEKLDVNVYLLCVANKVDCQK